MNHDVKQSKGLTHLTLVLNTGKETAKEKEGKKTALSYLVTLAYNFNPGRLKVSQTTEFCPKHGQGAPPLSLQPDLTFLVGKHLGPQEEPLDQMAFANCKLPLVPFRNLVSWGPKRI